MGGNSSFEPVFEATFVANIDHDSIQIDGVKVPDTGSTLGLLAFALAGLPLLRRKA